MKIVKYIPGIALSLLIALLALWIESLLPIHLIGAAVIAMFIGMIAAFLGFVFCDVGVIFKDETYGFTPVLVMLASALTMALAGLLVKVTKWRWLSDYALPVSLIVGMACAIPITAWLGSPETAKEAAKAAAESASLMSGLFC